MKTVNPIILVHVGIGLLLAVVWLNLRINIVSNREVGQQIQRQVEAAGVWTKSEHERFARDNADDIEDLRARVRRLESTTRPVKP